MAEQPPPPDQPQLVLITPSEFVPGRFAPVLAHLLDSHPVACLRLALATRDEDRLSRAADACREVAHDRDVAIVMDTHFILAERLGLDGVHLPDGARSVRKARKALGPDAIVGSHCGASRHEGMTAGEAGADYVSFGPVGRSALLGDGTRADRDLFEWWSEMIEIPVVAEGRLHTDLVRQLAPVADFLAIGDEIWQSDDPARALDRLIAALAS